MGIESGVEAGLEIMSGATATRVTMTMSPVEIEIGARIVFNLIKNMKLLEEDGALMKVSTVAPIPMHGRIVAQGIAIVPMIVQRFTIAGADPGGMAPCEMKGEGATEQIVTKTEVKPQRLAISILTAVH